MDQTGLRDRFRLQRFAAKLQSLTTAQNAFDALDVVSCRSDPDGVRPCRIDAQHASDCHHAAAGRVRCEVPAMFAQDLIQLFTDDSRLDSHPVAADRDNLVHMSRKVDNDASSDRSAGQSGTGTARNQRNAVVSRV